MVGNVLEARVSAIFFGSWAKERPGINEAPKKGRVPVSHYTLFCFAYRTDNEKPQTKGNSSMIQTLASVYKVTTGSRSPVDNCSGCPPVFINSIR